MMEGKDRKVRFESIKEKVLEHLAKLEEEENKTLKKSFMFALLGKSGKGLPVGTIREWKGKKFIKIAPGKWRPKYDSHTRGAKLAISALKKKIIACKDEHEMMQLILENRDRFTDTRGNPLPFVQELYEFTKENQNKIENKQDKNTKEKKQNKKIDSAKNTKEDGYPEKDYPEYKGKGQEAVNFIVKNKGGQVRGAFNRKEIGDIDVVWGEVTDKEKHTGYGLAHIIDKHGMEAVNKIGDVVKDGDVYRDHKNRLCIGKDKFELALREEWFGKEKIWIITNYEKKEVSAKLMYPSTDNTEGIHSETSTGIVAQTQEKSSTSLREKEKKALEYGFDLSNYYPAFSNEFQEADLDNDLYLCDRLSEAVKDYGLKREEIRAFTMDIHFNEGYRDITPNNENKWEFYNIVIPNLQGSDAEQCLSRLGFEKAREIFNKMLVEYKNILNEKNAKLQPLSNILETGKSLSVKHKELGEIIIDAGSTGKSGYGLKHIIEQRYKKDCKNEDEITALLCLIQDTLKDGKSKLQSSFTNSDDSETKHYEIEKDGILAYVSSRRFGKDEKFLLTGFDSKDKNKEAQDAIKTVIAQYDYTLEYSFIRNQVGAVIASLAKNVTDNNEKGKMKKSIVKHYEPSQSWKKVMAELKAVYNL